jgi:hypothetical protein
MFVLQPNQILGRQPVESLICWNKIIHLRRILVSNDQRMANALLADVKLLVVADRVD